jgi:hypothetical protein
MELRERKVSELEGTPMCVKTRLREQLQQAVNQHLAGGNQIHRDNRILAGD